MFYICENGSNFIRQPPDLVLTHFRNLKKYTALGGLHFDSFKLILEPIIWNKQAASVSKKEVGTTTPLQHQLHWALHFEITAGGSKESFV